MTKFVQIALCAIRNDQTTVRTTAALDDKGDVYICVDYGYDGELEWNKLPPHPDKGEE